MTLRPEYSLGHSEFNEFLFALIGEEKSGSELTVLSALARLGLDPWKEAARLSALPKEAATSALTATIARLPEGEWKVSESRSIALRLVDRLPRLSSSSTTMSSDGTLAEQKSTFNTKSWLPWIAFAAVLIAIWWQQTG
jgi:hypothetical protein